MIAACGNPNGASGSDTWADRLERVQTTLQRDPANPRAWFWRMQEKILTYFVHRYGDGPYLTDTFAAQPDRFGTTYVGRRPKQTQPLHSRQQIRDILWRIHDANQRCQRR